MSSNERKAVILVVDDMAANRGVLHDLVLMLGYAPRLACDGEEALHLVEENPPDLILLDIMMPGLDGCEVLERLKSDKRHANIPVIMVTALDDLPTTARCIQLGADDYLTKPFDQTLLRARILASLRKKQALDRERALHQELQDTYDRLKQSEMARECLAHMIVHDLNNPLTVISATCSLTQQMLAMGEAEPGMLRESLGNMYQAAMEMVRLTRGVLDVAKMESSEMPVQIVPVGVADLLDSIRRQHQAPAEVEGIELSMSAIAPSLKARADEPLLKRILQNLVANALKHTQPGVRVSLGAVERDGRCEISVSDNGPGIRACDLPHIFDKYYQAAARKEGRKYGVGVGLTFCKMAAEILHGSITAESEEGRGTTFRISLPLA